jgi:putative nucleotidyltransferase with HDIG domain
MVLHFRTVGVMKNNFRRLLLTFEALSELGPAITAERDFSETAPLMLASLMDAMDAREGVLFRFTDKPAMLASIAARGYTSFPEPAVIPLLPKHVHALMKAPGARLLQGDAWNEYLTSNGNIAPILMKCIMPLRVGARFVGMIGFGNRADGAAYNEEELAGLEMMSHYVSLAMHNHSLTETLAQRVTENLRLMSTVHNFYDTTLEAFAAAIDVKHVNIHGHSLRVGRYAGGISDAMGMEATAVSGIRASGYLHDIGKVAVDKALFGKTSALDPDEFRQMADHTIVGHQIVQGVHFPWPKVADVVRWHHERGDGSGYPDHLHADEMPEVSKIVAVADTFDAMTSERPYRHSFSVGEALNEIVKLAPAKFDPNAVQGLLIQVRRDAVATLTPKSAAKWGTQQDKPRFLDASMMCNIAPADVDSLAATLNHRLNRGRVYSA